MKIVIEIPKKLYEYMTHSATISNKEAVQWFVDFHKRIFVDGTPLPKGHGRLIDADGISYNHAIARNIEDGHNWNELVATKDEITDLPTIIEADKEGAEE